MSRHLVQKQYRLLYTIKYGTIQPMMKAGILFCAYQQKDEEIMRLREENTKLKEKLTEIDPDFVLEETFKRR